MRNIVAVILILAAFGAGWVTSAAVNQTDYNPIACFQYTRGVPYPLHPIPCP